MSTCSGEVLAIPLTLLLLLLAGFVALRCLARRRRIEAKDDAGPAEAQHPAGVVWRDFARRHMYLSVALPCHRQCWWRHAAQLCTQVNLLILAAAGVAAAGGTTASSLWVLVVASVVASVLHSGLRTLLGLEPAPHETDVDTSVAALCALHAEAPTDLVAAAPASRSTTTVAEDDEFGDIDVAEVLDDFMNRTAEPPPIEEGPSRRVAFDVPPRQQEDLSTVDGSRRGSLWTSPRSTSPRALSLAPKSILSFSREESPCDSPRGPMRAIALPTASDDFGDFSFAAHNNNEFFSPKSLSTGGSRKSSLWASPRGTSPSAVDLEADCRAFASSIFDTTDVEALPKSPPEPVFFEDFECDASVVLHDYFEARAAAREAGDVPVVAGDLHATATEVAFFIINSPPLDATSPPQQLHALADIPPPFFMGPSRAAGNSTQASHDLSESADEADEGSWRRFEHAPEQQAEEEVSSIECVAGAFSSQMVVNTRSPQPPALLAGKELSVQPPSNGAHSMLPASIPQQGAKATRDRWQVLLVMITFVAVLLASWLAPTALCPLSAGLVPIWILLLCDAITTCSAVAVFLDWGWSTQKRSASRAEEVAAPHLRLIYEKYASTKNTK